MIAYKATYNMKCRDLTYEVGKTYFISKLEICESGFHACKNIDDTLNYYDYNKETVFLEVEVLGEIVEKNDKLVTNKMKILRVVPTSEYNSLFEKYTFDERNNKISYTSVYGKKEFWEYDERNNLISHTDYDGEKVKFPVVKIS